MSVVYRLIKAVLFAALLSACTSISLAAISWAAISWAAPVNTPQTDKKTEISSGQARHVDADSAQQKPETRLYYALSVEDLAEAFLVMGLRFERETIDGQGIVANMRLNVIDGVRWSAIGYACGDATGCAEFQMRAVFKAAGDEATVLPQLNAWNASNRFTRAYLSSKGDTVILEMDVYLHGGQALQNITELVTIWRQSARSFSTQLSAP